MVNLQAGGGSLPSNLYLFDERNRAFLEYRSTELYPQRNPLVDHLLKALIPTTAIVVAILFMVSLFNSLKQARAGNNTSALTSVLSVMILLGLAVVIVSAPILYLKSVRMARQDRETLVRDGKVIFVPIEKCTLIRGQWRAQHLQGPVMRVRFSFVSPRSGRTITRTSTGAWPDDGCCLAVGTPIAVLFLNYKNYQVL